MGFLWMLLIMCAWMLYGGSKFYVNECNVHFDGECVFYLYYKISLSISILAFIRFPHRYASYWQL